MWQICTICGAIFDPAVADHYAWHAVHGETPPEPETEEEPDGDLTP